MLKDKTGSRGHRDALMSCKHTNKTYEGYGMYRCADCHVWMDIESLLKKDLERLKSLIMAARTTGDLKRIQAMVQDWPEPTVWKVEKRT